MYSDTVRTYTNDISKEKYIGVVWATTDKERCTEYVMRLKIEFQPKFDASHPLAGSQYEEVRCRRKRNHKGACLNNRPYSED
jgi:hypothetical protein